MNSWQQMVPHCDVQWVMESGNHAGELLYRRLPACTRCCSVKTAQCCLTPKLTVDFKVLCQQGRQTWQLGIKFGCHLSDDWLYCKWTTVEPPHPGVFKINYLHYSFSPSWCQGVFPCLLVKGYWYIFFIFAMSLNVLFYMQYCENIGEHWKIWVCHIKQHKIIILYCCTKAVTMS